MNWKNEKFIELLNNALKEVSRFVKSSNTKVGNDQPQMALEVLEKLKEETLSGNLRKPSRGIGWGLHQVVSEWTEDQSILDSAFAVEDFYKKHI